MPGAPAGGQPADRVVRLLLDDDNSRGHSTSQRSAGNCAAAGTYVTNGHGNQAFVVGQVNGTWRKAIQVPGTAALNTGGYATVTSVSCPSAGNCSAGGYYDGGGGLAFVVSQVNGTWGKAVQVPGTATGG